ncbi:hypothetical protein ACIQSP_20645 [Streptomyces nigra]
MAKRELEVRLAGRGRRGVRLRLAAFLTAPREPSAARAGVA